MALGRPKILAEPTQIGAVIEQNMRDWLWAEAAAQERSVNFLFRQIIRCAMRGEAYQPVTAPGKPVFVKPTKRF